MGADATPRPSLLVVAGELPWPARTGSRQRLAATLRALAALGDVDLAVVLPRGDRTLAGDAPADAGVSRLLVVAAPPRRRALTRLRWLVSRSPLATVELPGRAARRELATWARPEYDLVWHAQIAPGMAFGSPGPPRVLDFYDIEDVKIRGRISTTGGSAVRSPSGGSAVSAVRGMLLAIDARRWRRARRSLSRNADVVVACSDDDAARLGTPSARVVPNGADAVGTGPSLASRGPVVTMIGLMTYPPNLDAARWLVARALPELRAARPDLSLRLVGRHDGLLDDAIGAPGLHVAGEVEDLGPELHAARVLVAPVRYGSGTRVKVLEALAAGVPMVATPAAAEGIDVRHGEHLLLAERGEAFVAACLQLLGDPEQSERIAAAGRRLHAERYTWAIARAAMTGIAAKALGGEK